MKQEISFHSDNIKYEHKITLENETQNKMKFQTKLHK
jgi:hypothetical protein